MSTKKNSLLGFADRLEGDKVVWMIFMLLLLFSVVCTFSSTSRLLEGNTTRVDQVKEQLFFVALGLGSVILIYKYFSIKLLRTLSSFGFILSLILLVFLDTHAKIGSIRAAEINGAWRIIKIAGIQIHVMEVIKVAMCLYLAWAVDALKKGDLVSRIFPQWLHNMSNKGKKYVYIYAPFLIVFGLAMPAGNTGALFVAIIMFLVILLGGGNAKDLCKLAAGGIIIVAICFGIYKVSDGKKMQRIGTGISRIFDKTDYEQIFLDSERGSDTYQSALDIIRQPVSAKIAIKEGGIIGKGPGQSTQRYMVPAISEDYMYSFIIEEYGLIGGILIIFLYVSLLARGAIIARNCGRDLYAKLSVAGLCLLITLQAFLHIFVNADIGPMTGQTLPIISHGVSAFLCFCIAFGVILSISRSAVKRIEKETKAASPLVEHEEIRASLNDLDAFDSGEIIDEEYEL